MRGFEWRYGVPLLWRGLIHRVEMDQELDEELEFHRSQLIDSYIAGGLTRDRAELAARKTMAGLAATRDECRDMWHVGALDRLRRDVGFAWRRWRRAPGPTLAALATLTLAIGANAAIFSAVNAILLKRSPLANADRIVWMAEQTPGGEPSGVSPLNYADWRQRSRVFARVVAVTSNTIVMGDGNAPQQLRRVQPTAGFFEAFGVSPLLGRAFRENDEEAGQERVAILSHELWATRFGSDPEVIGRSIRLRGEPYDIVGVMGPDATAIHWGWAQVWTPLVTRTAAATRGYHQYNIYALLRPGATFDMAQADMARITRELAAEYPDTNRGWTAMVQRYQDTLVSPTLRRTLLLLWAAVGAVLLIGCVNLACLTLTQSVAREAEVAVRSALGASRRRLAAQMVTESAALGIAGGSLGIAVAYAGIAALRSMLPAFSAPGRSLPPASMLTMDGRVLAFAFIAGLVSGVAFGLVPAMTATRVDLQRFVKQAGTAAPGGHRLLASAIVAQSAIAFVLLTATGLTTRELVQLLRTDVGHDPDTVVTAQLPMTQARIRDTPESRAAYLDRILNAVAATPGVSDVALASVLPMMGGGSELPFHPDTSSQPFEASRAPIGFFKMVTPSYFAIVGQPIRRGRALADADTAASRRVAVINESLAHTYFQGVDPIGRTIQVPQVVATGAATLGPLERWQVIGIVPNERVRSLTDRSDMPGMYVPLAQSATRHPAIVVRAASHPEALPPLLGRSIARVDNDQALTDVRTLTQIKNDYALGERQRTALVLLFTAAALLLAGVGAYGVSGAVVAHDRRAIGIRLALGAPGLHAFYRVVIRAVVLAIAGLAIGALVVVAGLSAFDLTGVTSPRALFEAMGLAAVVLALVTLAASAVPAWHAAHISPLEGMKA